MGAEIDVTYDFRRDTPAGKDPDTRSKTLRQYHKRLWSKNLPEGSPFTLDDSTPRTYLHHQSDQREFWLSSDSVIPTFKWSPDIKKFVSEEELEAFNAVGYTIGGMMVFPANRIDKKWTINQARGCNRKIRDRFDLTLECIRCHYSGEGSPLTDVLARYESFFKLFENFQGYVEFFFLQDLVSDGFSKVRFSLPFDNFERSPIPADREQYDAYRSASIAFIEARNNRIRASV